MSSPLEGGPAGAGFEAVRTVLAVREFQDKPVPPDAARRIANRIVEADLALRSRRDSWTTANEATVVMRVFIHEGGAE